MKKLSTAILALCLFAAGGSVFAQDAMKSNEVTKDPAKMDAMGKPAAPMARKDAMAKDALGKDMTKSNEVTKDPAKKDAMGKPAPAMAKKDAMAKDAMGKDMTKSNEMTKDPAKK
jgi:pentapeptide MXKDX repeat protein